MADMLAITGPIYLVIAAGFLAVRWGYFAARDMRTLGRFAIDFALPAMIFAALAGQRIHEVLSATYLCAYLAGSLAVGLTTLAVLRLGRGRDATDSACYAMGAASSNSAFIGFPVLLLAVPAVAGRALALNAVAENLVFMPLFLFLAERGRQPGGGLAAFGTAFLRLFTRPLILGLVAGTVVAWAGVTLPPLLLRTTTLFAQASAVLSLFFVGGTLAGVRLGGVLGKASPLALVKLVLHPLAVWLALAAIAAAGLGSLDPPLRMAAVLMASMPIMSIYPVLVQRYGHDDLAAAALLVSTVGSFLTLNLLLWLLGRGAGLTLALRVAGMGRLHGIG